MHVKVALWAEMNRNIRLSLEEVEKRKKKGSSWTIPESGKPSKQRECFGGIKGKSFCQG
jgi:hypothetical protein